MTCKGIFNLEEEFELFLFCLRSIGWSFEQKEWCRVIYDSCG